jgi:hypothetical protein
MNFPSTFHDLQMFGLMLMFTLGITMDESTMHNGHFHNGLPTQLLPIIGPLLWEHFHFMVLLYAQ